MEGRIRRRLAVTRRCLEEDLHVIGHSWQSQVDEIPILRAFVDRRSASPIGQERIQELGRIQKAPVFSLHSRDDRGGTWHDEEDDIVWLLAVGRSHDYDHLANLGRRRRLLPTVEDYEVFELAEESPAFVDAIVGDAASLIEAAHAHRDEPIEGLLAGRIRVRVCVESGDPDFLVVAVSKSVLPGDQELSAEWQYELASVFFGEVPFSDFPPFPLAFDRTHVRADELALRHFAP
jgi:hypothetical protein